MNPLFYFLYAGTIILLLVGAQLQVLKTALVCPDWPLCFGEFLPYNMGPAYYESLHRFLAVIVGLGSVAWAITRYKELKAKSLLPLFLVILQSFLGWATFNYKLAHHHHCSSFNLFIALSRILRKHKKINL